ncbi:MAG: PAS domain S-box protein [Chitinivibrionales bacterium]|nr:PAS domain S-box protein [Chitinivibrionales bacterium]
MNADAEEYRQYVRANLDRVLELLAHMSFGDFTHRVDVESLPNDEFGDLFCGLDMLMADLAEARRELDDQYRYSQIRGEMWQIATRSYPSVPAFVQMLLDFLGPKVHVMRASYYEIEGDNAVCRTQWTRGGLDDTVGLQIPRKLWNVLSGERYLELHRDHLHIPGAAAVRVMMERGGAGSMIAVPCGSLDSLFGIVAFSDEREQRTWSDPEKAFLFEMARVITTKAGQVRAEEALRSSHERLENEVAARTVELEQANRELQDDIEKRKKAESALSESEALYRSLVETSPDAILVCDGDGAIIMSNASACEIFGAGSRSELVGSALQSYVSAGDHDGMQSLWDALRDGAQGVTDEVRLVRLDGEQFLGEFRAITLGTHNGGHKRRLVIVRDITQKRREEEELQKASKLESLGTLAGGIAHDFNNLLTSIISNISFSREELKGSRTARRLLEDAEAAAIRASSLTQQLLTFAKGGSPVKVRTSLKELIESSARFCLSGSNVAFRTELEPDLHPVEVDVSQIEQVLHNLIINADQAMPGGGSIVITARNCEVEASSELPVEPGTYVRVSIRDSGHGIPEENRRRIYDPYFTTKAAGSGLGLTTAFSVVRRHRGCLSCSSTVGQGTEFSFYLPASPGPLERTPRRRKRAVTGHGRILAMDDDPSIRLVLERLLVRAGYEVTVVADGDAALAAYREAAAEGERFDAVIMDLTVQGGKGGKQAARELLDFDPEARIIVVSGYSADPVISDYKAYGFSAMVAKPFQTSELTSVVRATITGDSR